MADLQPIPDRDPIHLKGGYVTYDERLGRVPFFDDRSRDYQVRELLGTSPSLSKLRTLYKRRRSIDLGPLLYQNGVGACTGFSPTAIFNSEPFHGDTYQSDEYAYDYYYENQRVDEWEGGEYPGATPQYAGSSVLASMKVAKARDLISEYRWVGAGSQSVVADIVDTLRYLSGICFGVDWLGSMFTTDIGGVMHIDPSSGFAGGHAIAGVDCLWTKPVGNPYALYLVLQNSWTTSADPWGIGYRWSVDSRPGFCYVKVDEQLEWLMDERQGEGAVPLPKVD